MLETALEVIKIISKLVEIFCLMYFQVRFIYNDRLNARFKLLQSTAFRLMVFICTVSMCAQMIPSFAFENLNTMLNIFGSNLTGSEFQNLLSTSKNFSIAGMFVMIAYHHTIVLKKRLIDKPHLDEH